MKLSERLRRFTPLLLALTLFAGIAPAQTTADTSKATATKHPFLWRIDGQGGQNFKVKSWLYGTMHLGDKRLVTLPKVVNEAREAADALYCELDMTAMSRNQLKMTKLMLLPKGETLRGQMSPELYARLDKYVRHHGSSIRRFNKMRVWAVNLSLATLDIVKLGFTQSLDNMIYKEARSDGLEVGGLETMDEQIKALTGGSESDNLRFLEQALDIGEEYDAENRSPLREMLEAYLSGEMAQLVAKLEESNSRDPELNKRIMKSLLDDRNVRMADRMTEKLTAHPDKSYFFAVGAMHYPGEMGVLKLMRAKGYRITRINPPPATTSADLTAQVTALEQRIEQLTETLDQTATAKAALEARVRKLEVQVRALEKRLR